MRMQKYQSQLGLLWQSRNGYFILALGSLFCTLLLTALLALSWQRREVVLVPPTLNASATLSARGVSASYLRQWSEYLLGLRFNVSPAVVDRQYRELLTYVAPQYAPALEKHWIEEAKSVKAQALSQVFYLEDLQVLPHELSVIASGTLKRTIGTTQVLGEKRQYRLRYTWRQGRLWIVSLKGNGGEK